MNLMSHFMRPYGLLSTLDGLVLITRGAQDFKSNPTLVSGDVKVSLDGGAFANIEGMTPANFPNYVQVLPAAGTNVRINLDSSLSTCRRLVIRFIDQTGPKEWEDYQVVIETYARGGTGNPPPNAYLAQFGTNLDQETQTDDLVILQDYLTDLILKSRTVIFPMLALSNANVKMDQNVVLFQHSILPTIQWGVYDSKGALVDLTGHTVRCIVWDPITNKDVYVLETGGSGVSVASQNQVVLTYNDTVHTLNPISCRYALWDITTKSLLAKGIWSVLPVLRDHVP